MAPLCLRLVDTESQPRILEKTLQSAQNAPRESIESRDIKDTDTQATFGLDSYVNGQNTEMRYYSRIQSKNCPSIGIFEHPKIGVSKIQILRPLLDWIHTSMGKTLKCATLVESNQQIALVSASLSIPKCWPGRCNTLATCCPGWCNMLANMSTVGPAKRPKSFPKEWAGLA